METARKMMRFGHILCPKCYWKIILHGSYKRHVKDAFGKRHDGWVAQGHCVHCNTYPSLIPDFIMPYKHYMGEVIEAAIMASEEDSQDLSDCPADASTIRRWVNQFNERGVLAVGWLLALLFSVYGYFVSILGQHNTGLLKRLDCLTQQFPVHGTDGIIGRANIILTKHGHGFL